MLARRLLIALTAALLAAVAVPAHGQPRPLPGDVGPIVGGGAFVIQSCGETGSAEGWSATNNATTHVATGINCPPDIAGQTALVHQTGLWVTERLGNTGGWEATPGDRAELSFSPLAGTTVTRVRWWRLIGKTADNSWQPYTAIGSNANVIDTCEINPQVSNVCGVGSDDWRPNDTNFDYDVFAYADLQGLSTTKVMVGLFCRDLAESNHLCGGGYSANHAVTNVFSAFLTIADAAGPTLGPPGGQAWTTDAFVNGTVPVTLSSTDLTGIRETRAYLDGQLVATTSHSGCSYTRPRPCTDEPGATVNVPTIGLADGGHALAVGAIDAAGNESRITRSTPLRVDNNPPAAPVGLTSSAPSSQTNSFSASWSLPADNGTPITAARYQLCQNGACGAVQTAPSLTGLSGLSLAAPGSATLRVWLQDQAQHELPAGAATLTLTYALPAPTTTTPPTVTPPPTVPAPPPTTLPPPAIVKTPAKLRLTTLRRRAGTVTVSGSLTAKASGHVTVRYRVRLRGRTHTLTKRVPIRRHAFRTALRLSPTFARARAATVSVAYGGDADTHPQTRVATLRTAG